MGYADFKHFDERDALFRSSKGKLKPAPELPQGTLVADTHCHLGMFPDPGLVLAQAAAHGVDFICCMTDPTKPELDGDDGDVARRSARQTYDGLDGWFDDAAMELERWGMAQAIMPRVRFACGVHPHNAKYFEQARDELVALIERPETCCLGEIGLDYHYDLSPREVQRKVFAAQLSMAQECSIPVSLHLREAHDEALGILREVGVPDAGCILHCFNLDAATLAPFLELGCYIAFGGPLTFKKSWDTRLAALDVPVDRLLTETDGPYMAPEPLRGTVCAPSQTVFTLRTLLDCFGYAGEQRAIELISPRQSDIENGTAEPVTAMPDYPALQRGLDEGQFAERVFQNALDLLDARRA
ncbi:MAG: TatD family hydrolase [Coriobacteriales bacterium]